MLRFNRPQFLVHIPKLLIALLLVAPTAVVRSSPAQAAPNATLFVSNSFDSGAGSLREAILQLNANPGADTISINFNLTTLFLATALPTITDPVTIRANGGFIIDGQNLRRGLTIANVHANISGITIQRAAAFGTSQGGGIVSDGPLSLTNVTVLSSTAWLGGGVSGASTISITGGRFEGNSATNNGGAISAGGAVVMSGTVIRNNFCTASTCDGGGLDAAAALILTNTHFIGNMARNRGGGFKSLNGLVLSGGTLMSNTASSGGGGAWVIGPAQLTNTRFERNQVAGNDGTGSDGGGGLLATSSVPAARLTNVDFVKNSTQLGNGGGMRGADVIINGGLFEQNQGGGGLRADFLVFTNTRFISNATTLDCFVFANAGPHAGGAAVLGGLHGFGGSFERNHGSCAGGLKGNLVRLTDTQFISNTSTNGPGGAFATDFGGTGVRFSENRSFGFSPAGMYATSSVLTGCIFSDNDADIGSGGGIYSAVKTSISGCSFVNNQAASGGAIRAIGNITVSGSSFVNNQAATSGGGVHATGNLTVSQSTFLGNSAANGGGVEHGAGDSLFVNSVFARNTASGHGAAIYLLGSGRSNLTHLTVANAPNITTTAISTSKTNVIVKNMILANHAVGINVISGFVALLNTLYHGNAANAQGILNSDASPVSGDPRFVNSAADNYHLRIGSPAINNGLNADVTSDIDGDLRPTAGGYDIGYDEVSPLRRIALPVIVR